MGQAGRNFYGMSSFPSRWEKMTPKQRAMSNKRVARWKKANPEKARKQSRESARRMYAVDPGRHIKAVTKWQAINKQKYAASRRRADLAKYGITEREYEAMLTGQGGRCAICGADDPGSRRNSRLGAQHWPVDHCHDTGRVRGLLCGSCNAGIAMLKHDRRILAQADSYLMRSN